MEMFDPAIARLAFAARRLIVLMVLLAGPASLADATAQHREALRGVALVIGQSAYKALAPLPNPENDARAIDRLLSDLGFDVDMVLDGDSRRLGRALERFEEDAAEADVALVYYSGHGVEAGGENFLVPIDAAPPARGGAATGLVAIGPVLDRLRRASPVVIVLLDACRDNPYPPGTLAAAPDGATVAISASGLGAPRGGRALKQANNETLATVLGFAAEPGRAALDGRPGGNSPYAAALVKHLAAGGYAFGDVMTMVTEEVYLLTAGRQLPWTNASLRRQLYFGRDAESAVGDERAIRDGRRELLLTIAMTPAATRDLVAGVAAANGVPLDALYGMLAALGVDASRSGDLERRLSEGAARLQAIMAARDVQTRQDPEIVRLAGLADAAEAEGLIGLALGFRDRASRRADGIDAALDEAEANIAGRRLELAQTYARHAETAALGFDFATAADRYAAAFDQSRRWDPAGAYGYKIAEADALADLGQYRPDNAALERSIATYEEAIVFAGPRADVTGARGNMAIAMTLLAQRSTDMTWLDRAAGLYREMSATISRKRQPEEWATLRINLGGLLQEIVQRGGDPRLLNEAIAAYGEAAEHFSRRARPEVWAGLQQNIGNALYSRNRMTGDAADLRQSIRHLEAALSVWTREGEPQDWAMASANLAGSLQTLAVETRDTGLLRRAIEHIEAALTVQTRERQPDRWAGTMGNLGSAYVDLAGLTDDAALFPRAVEAFAAQRLVHTREADPVSFARAWYNEGRALLGWAGGGDIRRFVDADKALRNAIEILDRDAFPVPFARARSGQGEALAGIGRAYRDRAALIASREAFDEARQIFRTAGMGEQGQGFWEKQIAAIDADLAAMK